MTERCGIKHGFHDGTCIRHKGHDGLCRCRAEPGNGMLTYSEWRSRDGLFESHAGYVTIYPANMRRDTR